ncbi:hypothetical protein HYY27_11045, partial [bacterium]|nr:hypothetical protein [bacterium]
MERSQKYEEGKEELFRRLGITPEGLQKDIYRQAQGFEGRFNRRIWIRKQSILRYDKALKLLRRAEEALLKKIEHGPGPSLIEEEAASAIRKASGK